MFEACAVLVGPGKFLAKEQPPVMPEPEFKPFKFAEPSSEPAAVALAPSTLQEMGVDGSLVKEMELVLRLLGHTKGAQVVGYLFRTPDGTPHTLKMSIVPAEDLGDRAA